MCLVLHTNHHYDIFARKQEPGNQDHSNQLDSYTRQRLYNYLHCHKFACKQGLYNLNRTNQENTNKCLVQHKYHHVHISEHTLLESIHHQYILGYTHTHLGPHISGACHIYLSKLACYNLNPPNQAHKNNCLAQYIDRHSHKEMYILQIYL